MDQSSIPTNICTKCHEEKPLDAFAIDRRRGKTLATCRLCVNAHNRARYKADPESHRARCKRWEEANRERVREYRHEWAIEHADLVKEQRRKKRAENPEAHREQVRRWKSEYPEASTEMNKRSEAKRKGTRSKYSQEYLAANRETIARKKTESRKQQGDVALLREREYQARKRAADRGLPSVAIDYAAILARDGFVCCICSQPIVPRVMAAIEFDHRIPIEKGGPHTPENVGVAHKSCNKRKWKHLGDGAA